MASQKRARPVSPLTTGSDADAVPSSHLMLTNVPPCATEDTLAAHLRGCCSGELQAMRLFDAVAGQRRNCFADFDSADTVARVLASLPTHPMQTGEGTPVVLHGKYHTRRPPRQKSENKAERARREKKEAETRVAAEETERRHRRRTATAHARPHRSLVVLANPPHIDRFKEALLQDAVPKGSGRLVRVGKEFVHVEFNDGDAVPTDVAWLSDLLVGRSGSLAFYAAAVFPTLRTTPSLDAFVDDLVVNQCPPHATLRIRPFPRDCVTPSMVTRLRDSGVKLELQEYTHVLVLVATPDVENDWDQCQYEYCVLSAGHDRSRYEYEGDARILQLSKGTPFLSAAQEEALGASSEKEALAAGSDKMDVDKDEQMRSDVDDSAQTPAAAPADLNDLRSTVNKAAHKVSEGMWHANHLLGMALPAEAGTTVAIDVGASPGGWTHQLLVKGVASHVISIDPAPLVPELLSSGTFARCGDITALQMLAEDAIEPAKAALKGLGVAHCGLVVCDVNMDARDACSKLIEPLACLMCPGAVLVLTLKLRRRSGAYGIQIAVDGAKVALGDSFAGFQTTHLLANTKNERTLFAVRK